MRKSFSICRVAALMMTGSVRWGIVLVAGVCLSGCVGLQSGKDTFTKDHSRRQDQVGWIQEDLGVILANYFAKQSRKDPDRVDARVAANINQALQICFSRGSLNGEDPDGGIRAMNFFKKAYFDANGEYWTWRRAVDARRQQLFDENDPFSPSVIPEGYR